MKHESEFQLRQYLPQSPDLNQIAQHDIGNEYFDILNYLQAQWLPPSV